MYKNVIYFTCFALLTFTFILLLKSATGKTRFSTRLFAWTTLLTTVWISFLWVGDTTSSIEVARTSLNFAVFFLGLVSWAFLLFAFNYPNRSLRRYMPLIWAALAYNALFLWLAVSEQIVQEVSLSEFGASIEEATAIYNLHVVQSMIFVISGLVLLNLRKKRLESKEKLRINFMTLGIMVALVGNGLSGSVATYVNGFAWLNIVATVSTVSFVLVIGYAIIKHQLFDVRTLVLRSVTYLLLVTSFAGIFALVSFGIVARLPGQLGSSSLHQAIYTVTAVVLAFLFQPLRKLFDRITNSLFYQDAYDPQAFLDELNQVIVSNIELETLLNKCVAIIERNMKVGFCLFSIEKTTYSERRLIGNNHKKLEDDDIQKLHTVTPSMRQRLIVADELEDQHESLRKMLVKNNIAVVGRLASDTSHVKDGVGYLVLGPKKSGNIFNKQDIRVLEIITKGLVVATENALRFEEIQKFNVTLQEKVDNATRQLRHSNERLKMLDQTKDDFISMASHQLRTPLTSVKGYLSMVLEGDAGKLNEKERKLLSQAFFSSQRMVYLIADLLNVSRLRTGKFVIEPTPVNLADVIEGEVEQLVETAASRNLKLTYEKPKDFPTLMFDETKIRQVIMNFMDNAIHYTPSGGHIHVQLTETPQTIEYTVADDGIGVSKTEQHHLFTKFFRAGNAKKARPDGTGLGLFMAKKVIVAQGGSIIFKSQEGKGSTFGFVFAKSKLAAPTTV